MPIKKPYPYSESTVDEKDLYNPSKEDLQFIMDEESFKPTVYDDLTRKPLSKEDILNRAYKGSPTIGYGHKLTDKELQNGKVRGKDIYQGLDEEFARNMVPDEDAIKLTKRYILDRMKGQDRVELTPEELRAMYSFGYNVGPTKMRDEVLNLPSKSDMAEKMKTYTKSKKQELEGLINRRQKEYELMKGKKYADGSDMPSADELNQMGQEEAINQAVNRNPSSLQEAPLQPQPDMLNTLMREYQDLRKGEAGELSKLQDKKKTSDWLSALSGIASIGGKLAPNRVDINPIDFSEGVNQEIANVGSKRKAGLDELTKMYDIYSKMRPKSMSPYEEAKLKQDRYLKELELSQKKENKGLNLTPAQKASDIEFGKTVAKDMVGAKSNAESAIKRFEDSINTMEKNKDMFSGTANTVIEYLPFGESAARSMFNPKLQELKQNLENIIYQELRPVLGAQFTENEGRKFLETSFDPKLGAKVNIQRAKDFLNRAKAQYESRKKLYDVYSKTGTISQIDPNELPTVQNISTPQVEYVKLRAPNGEIKTVKKDASDKYIKKGATIIEE